MLGSIAAMAVSVAGAIWAATAGLTKINRMFRENYSIADPVKLIPPELELAMLRRFWIWLSTVGSVFIVLIVALWFLLNESVTTVAVAKAGEEGARVLSDIEQRVDALEQRMHAIDLDLQSVELRTGAMIESTSGTLDDVQRDIIEIRNWISLQDGVILGLDREVRTRIEAVREYEQYLCDNASEICRDLAIPFAQFIEE